MKKIFLFSLLLIVGFWTYSNDLPKRPDPPTLVTDFANVFSVNERAQLESKLVEFFASTSTQIAVVTVADLGGNEIADYAFKLGEAWGIGDAKFNNGILLLIKPKTSNGKGEVFVAVGYGLEGVVPDGTAKQIVENELIPRFKENDLFGGVESATTVLIELTKGEYNYQQYAQQAKSGQGFSPFLLFILIFFVLPILFGRKRKSFYSAGGRSTLPFLVALGMLGSSRSSHSGFFNDFSSGSGSFGGGGKSFGSFGGFGGGGFGGGGAGGSW
jgi:uncharacterized protein